MLKCEQVEGSRVRQASLQLQRPACGLQPLQHTPADVTSGITGMLQQPLWNAEMADMRCGLLQLALKLPLKKVLHPHG